MTRRQREDAKRSEAKPSRDASKSNRTGHNWADRARDNARHQHTHIHRPTHTHTTQLGQQLYKPPKGWACSLFSCNSLQSKSGSTLTENCTANTLYILNFICCLNPHLFSYYSFFLCSLNLISTTLFLRVYPRRLVYLYCFELIIKN